MTGQWPGRGSSDWVRELRSLADQAVDQPQADWDVVVEDAFRLAAAVATLELSVDAGLVGDEVWLVEAAHWPSEVAEAIQRVAPEEDLAALRFVHSQQLAGWVNTTTGSLFELRIGDADLGAALPHGADALRLANRTQQGWDAELLKHGHVVGHVQLKASMTDDIIREHLRHFPTLQDVITTKEAAAEAARHGIGHVIDSGIAYGDVHDPVAATLQDHWGAGHLIHEWVPVISLAMIGYGYVKLRRSGIDRLKAGDWATHQAKVAGIANAAGAGAAIATHHPLVRFPTVVLTRFLAGRRDAAGSIAEFVARQRGALSGLLIS